MSLEILLREIRKENELKGTKIRKEHYKLRAYADDMVFIIENQIENMEKWVMCIEDFGKVAGLKINKNKTKI